MGQINLPTNLLDRIKRVEDQISRLWKAVGLSSATIAAGGLTLLNSAFLKMLGPTDNELVYIGPDGLGNQVIRIRDAAGHIIFANVSSGGTSQRVAINPNPAGPARIEFYDDGSTTDRVSLSLNGGNFVQQRELQSTSAINGGKVSFYSGQTYFGHQTATTEAYFELVDDESIFVRGRWANFQTLGGHAAVHAGGSNVGAGPINFTHGYGATMADTMHPVVTLQADAADRYWAVTASTATSFTVGVSGGSSNQIHYWALRTI